MADQIVQVFPSHNELALLGRPMNGQDLINLRNGLAAIKNGDVQNSDLASYEFEEAKFSVLSGFPY